MFHVMCGVSAAKSFILSYLIYKTNKHFCFMQMHGKAFRLMNLAFRLVDRVIA